MYRQPKSEAEALQLIRQNLQTAFESLQDAWSIADDTIDTADLMLQPLAVAGRGIKRLDNAAGLALLNLQEHGGG
mgnify:FL=1